MNTGLREKALRLLARRDHTRAELVRKLRFLEKLEADLGEALEALLF